MLLSRQARDLLKEIETLPVIDAHEHLPPEVEYLAHAYAGPNLFAGGYVWHDLESAGMSSEFKATLRDGGSRPIDQWWPQIRPHWEQVKQTSYCRALRITARDLYGIEEINDQTIGRLAECVRADNQPGLYKRILCDRCGIEHSITIAASGAVIDEAPLKSLVMFPCFPPASAKAIDDLAARVGGDIRSVDDLLGAAESAVREDLRAGALGFKMRVGPYGPADVDAAGREFERVRRGEEGALPNLTRLMFDRYMAVAADVGVPVAVHTGYWGDFRELDPKLMLDFAFRHANVRFDLFHLGMPMIRDAILIGKSLPNVTLNLCWCYLISQTQTRRALDEIFDMAPLNKIIAFGADYRVAVQKVYGHLVMARETVAAALADRVDAGDISAAGAVTIARQWFYDNPVRIYGLPGR